MTVHARDERGPIALAEKVLTLLDEGTFTATYKYAVLLGLMDLCMENTSRTGEAPDTVTTRQLAEKVLEIYWPQSAPFHVDSFPEPTVLTQNRGAPETQAAILRGIVEFRREQAPDPSSPLPRARSAAPRRFERLVRFVEWKLIQMPLPRVQYFGNAHDEFLYSIAWDRDVRQGEVSQYQRGEGGPFDNRIQLRPRVGEHLVLLNGLLRPLIHRQWAAMVAKMNELEEARLEEFLFGAERIPLDPVRPGLRELQEGRCFYCDGRLRGSGGRRPAVDHFIPWSRYPNNAVENLVVAHERCNGRKRDFLAAPGHVSRWRGRFGPELRTAPELEEVAREARWETAPERSVSVTRAIYLRLPPDARLWQRKEEFVEAEPEELRAALG
jgi:5-methylcytosine-specific restriction endonuclease McrA